MILGQTQQFASPEEAVKHYGVKGMRWGVRKDRETSPQDLASKLTTGTAGPRELELTNIKALTFDASKGYLDVRPKNGFANDEVATRHAELTKTLEEMRARYPAVAKMDVAVIPMSHYPSVASMTNESFACVQAMRPGQAHVIYNDVKGKLSSYEASYVKDFMPGMATKDYLGNHEMGHLLASVNGTMPPTNEIIARGYRPRDIRKWTKQKHKRHKQLLKKHGLSYKELRKISKYAATEPSEALAELSGHYFTPGLKSTLSPDTQRKAEALFNDLGGVR